MCKFTNRLFVFVLLSLLRGEAYTVNGGIHFPQRRNLRSFFDMFTQDYDYDLNYDQRQKGNENVRLKMDGFFVGMPAQESSELMLMTDDILENLNDELLQALQSKSRSSTSSPNHFSTINAEITSTKGKDEQYKKSETVIVEIPATKRDNQARNRMENVAGADKANAFRRRFKISDLLRFLVHSNKN